MAPYIVILYSLNDCQHKYNEIVDRHLEVWGCLLNKLLFLCFIIFFNLQLASANIFYHGQYRVGLYKDEIFNREKISHVIIVGSAVKEDSDQFFQSGIARAQRYKELWPEHQIILLSSPEVKGKDDKSVFEDYNINVVKVVKETFTQDKLIEELKIKKNNPIAKKMIEVTNTAINKK